MPVESSRNFAKKYFKPFRLTSAGLSLLSLGYSGLAPRALADSCSYAGVFAKTHTASPDIVGDCLDNQAIQPNGDLIQNTVNGHLVFHSDGSEAFYTKDGTLALTDNSLVSNVSLPSATHVFVLGFKMLHDLDPQDTSDPVDDEAHNPKNGDGLQHTNNGLMVWRKADNWTAFTNGYWTWVNGPNGLQKRLNTERFPWEADDGTNQTVINPDSTENTAVAATPVTISNPSTSSQASSPTAIPAATATPDNKTYPTPTLSPSPTIVPANTPAKTPITPTPALSPTPQVSSNGVNNIGFAPGDELNNIIQVENIIASRAPDRPFIPQSSTDKDYQAALANLHSQYSIDYNKLNNSSARIVDVLQRVKIVRGHAPLPNGTTYYYPGTDTIVVFPENFYSQEDLISGEYKELATESIDVASPGMPADFLEKAPSCATRWVLDKLLANSSHLLSMFGSWATNCMKGAS